MSTVLEEKENDSIELADKASEQRQEEGEANIKSLPPHLDGEIHMCGRFSIARLAYTRIMYRADIFLDILSSSLLVTVLPKLMVLTHKGSFSKASSFQGACTFLMNGLTLFGAPFLGNLSDLFGHRIIMIVVAAGQIVTLVLLAVDPIKWTILLYFAVAGVMGGLIALLLSAVAHIARMSQRSGSLAAQFGMAAVALSLATAAGPLVGGALYHYSEYAALLTAAGFLVLFIINTATLPEVLSVEQRKKKVELKELIPVSATMAAVKDKHVAAFILPYLCQIIGASVRSSLVLFLMRRYHWNSMKCGAYWSAQALIKAFAQSNVKRLSPYFTERQLASIGVTAHLGCVLILGIARNEWATIPAAFLMGIAGLRLPTFLSILTSNAPDTGRGVLIGTLTSLKSFAAFVGAPLYAVLLAWSMQRDTIAKWGEDVMGAIFIVAAGFDLLSLATFTAGCYYTRHNIEAQAAEKPREPMVPEMCAADSKVGNFFPLPRIRCCTIS